jgi:hypothetical protein
VALEGVWRSRECVARGSVALEGVCRSRECGARGSVSLEGVCRLRECGARGSVSLEGVWRSRECGTADRSVALVVSDYPLISHFYKCELSGWSLSSLFCKSELSVY